LHTDFLVDSLHNRFGIDKRTIKPKLKAAMRGRYRAWAPDGDTWMLPANH
jgi:hypothetical protein